MGCVQRELLLCEGLSSITKRGGISQIRESYSLIRGIPSLLVMDDNNENNDIGI